jgi:hypothetical protein
MTRSFDAIDRDDFRSPNDPDRGTSGGSESFWSLRIRLSELHRKEDRADARDRAERDAAFALERAIYGDLFPVVPNIENRNNFAALN